MFLDVLKKKNFIMKFIYCRRLNSQYFGAPKSGAPRCVAPCGCGKFLRHWKGLVWR